MASSGYLVSTYQFLFSLTATRIFLTSLKFGHSAIKRKFRLKFTHLYSKLQNTLSGICIFREFLSPIFLTELFQLEQTLTDPLLCVPPRAQLAIPGGFAYSETKLRPDAPAFTPESLTRCGPGARGIGEITDSVCGEPTIAHQPEIDDSCFVNIELDSSLVEDVDVPQPKRKRFSVSHPTEPKAFIRDSRDPIKEPGLKPFSLTPRLKRSGPRIQASEDSIQDNNESGPIAAVSDAIEPEITQDGPATGEPQIARGRWRIFRTSFFIANKIQIAVLIASITICCIIIIYVAVWFQFSIELIINSRIIKCFNDCEYQDFVVHFSMAKILLAFPVEISLLVAVICPINFTIT